jgi:hypothetical protein
VDVLGRASEALAVPVEVAYCRVSADVHGLNQVQHTVVVADIVVQVDLGVVPLAIGPLKAGSEHVSVIDTNVLGRVVERHVVDD